MSLLTSYAWNARKRAIGRVRSGVPVGAAVLTSSESVVSGCNIELPFRVGLHAEVNALSTMLTIAASSRPLLILVAAEAERFTPCGGCMDWIMSLNPGVMIQHEDREGHITGQWEARELMPYYPKAA